MFFLVVSPPSPSKPSMPIRRASVDHLSSAKIPEKPPEPRGDSKIVVGTACPTGSPPASLPRPLNAWPRLVPAILPQ